jgi:uncharacterized cupredoxin-like copper-binding protein
MGGARLATAAAVLASALALAACGEDREEGTDGGAGATGGETGATTTGPPVATVQVGETEFALNPANPTIEEAGVIEFQIANQGEADHALEIETPDGEVETDVIRPGGTADLKVDLKPGKYTWYCPIGDHRDRGMRGTITVGGKSAGGSGTGDTTEDSTDDDRRRDRDSGDDDGGSRGSGGGGSGGDDDGGRRRKDDSGSGDFSEGY